MPTPRKMSQSARAEARFPADDTPLVLDPAAPRVWGVPLDAAWWCDPARAADLLDAIPMLGARSRAARAASRPAFAAQVASAYAEVRSWERAGVAVRGRRWIDLGGGDGAYVVALRVCGASAVTLVDKYAPAAAAKPVLAAADARVIVGDLRKVEPIEADGACFLHVTLPVMSVFSAAPRVDVVVIDGFFGQRDAGLRPGGWSARRIRAVVLDGAMARGALGQRVGIATARTREPRIVWERVEPPR